METQRFFRPVLPACATLLLCGCLGGLLPFAPETHYTLSGVEQNQDLSAALEQVIKNATATPLEESDDPDLNARRESYREEMLRSDLVKMLHAQGYYDGKVTYDDHASDALTGNYAIVPGEQYKIATIETNPPEYAEQLDLSIVRAGETLDAANVLTQQQSLLRSVQKGRCYFSLNIRNAVTLDRTAKTAEVTYEVDAGPEGTFGAITLEGLTSVRESFIRARMPWKEGECFSREKIEQFQASLLESGLFVRVESVLPDAPESDGAIPIELRLTERAHRTMRAGLSYYTNEGLGAVFGWEHRNFLGEGEKLSATLNLSMLKQSIETKLTRPYFMRPDQTLSLSSNLRRQDTDAFEEIGIDFGAQVSRRFNKRLSGSVGVNIDLTRITEKNNLNPEETFYGLISAPARLNYDSRNDTMDPSRGWLASFSVTPFIDAMGESDPFVKIQASASTYLAFDDAARAIMALRVSMGSILGTGAFDIPPTERFYAGGGGSIRGYGYQEVGPKDTKGDPVGGRSMATGSAELRYKITDTIGAVAFVDAGTVSEETYPEWDRLAVGAGVGVRYYTGFGPIRFDIAVPLTEKEDIDQNFQFYISIGQAF